MLNSRDIDRLRPDVAANCRAWLELCRAAGLLVLVTGTVRDEEYQQYCFENGTAATPVPSFHGEQAGLAFDFCQNIKGQEYSDSAFFQRAGELGECLTRMVMEPTVYQEMKETIGMKPEDAYFNSGVILMDLARWRAEDVLKKLLDFYGAHAGSLFACDQDTINGALRGRICSLPPKYNFFTNYRYFRYQTLKKLCAAYEEVGEQAFYEAKRAPVVIHYLGDERPWIRGNHNHYKKYYKKYLTRTPWKDMPLTEGKFLYMQLWWCFNQMTRLCPALRLAISRRLGMRVIDARKTGKERK